MKIEVGEIRKSLWVNGQAWVWSWAVQQTHVHTCALLSSIISCLQDLLLGWICSTSVANACISQDFKSWNAVDKFRLFHWHLKSRSFVWMSALKEPWKGLERGCQWALTCKWTVDEQRAGMRPAETPRVSQLTGEASMCRYLPTHICLLSIFLSMAPWP